MSKRIIYIALLILLLSACTYQVITPISPTEQVRSTQVVPSNTVEYIPTVPAPSATLGPLPTLDLDCTDAPTPHVEIGEQVTVTADNTDKLKLRSEPQASPNTVKMDLDIFPQLKILRGPICNYSSGTVTTYWFWKVSVIPSGEIGWVAEGDSQHYFIEASTVAAISDTATPSSCPGAPTPRVMVGQQATVITKNSDKLKLRELPVIAQNTEGMGLDQFTQLKILEGPICFHSDQTGYSYWFWKVKVFSLGAVGWVAEGDSLGYFIGPSQ